MQIELEAILSLNQDLLPQNDNTSIIPNKLSKVSDISFLPLFILPLMGKFLEG